MSVRQFSQTTGAEAALADLPTIPSVAVSSASRVEDLHVDDVGCKGYLRGPRVRARHHRTLKRSRKPTAVRKAAHDRDHDDDQSHGYFNGFARSIFLNEDFPPLPIEAPLPEPAQETIEFGTKALSERKSYKVALCDYSKPAEVFCHIPRALLCTPKFSSMRHKSQISSSSFSSSHGVEFAPSELATQAQNVSHLVQIFKDKRRRITAIKKASTLNLLRREIAQIIGQHRSKPRNRRLEPLSVLLSLHQHPTFPAQPPLISCA